MKTSGNFQINAQLAAGSVDVPGGKIRSATVAQANVQAVGHRVMLDAANKVVLDEKLSIRSVNVFTDDKTLDTLMAAVAGGGGKFKTREDHNDAIGARAGYADAFVRTGDRVTANIELFPSYKNRDTVLAAASQTPRDIGLSIDFLPEFEIVGDRALMRIVKLDAVDIVDKGAITPGGMFLSVGVDTEAKGQPAKADQPPTPAMPDAPAGPSSADLMAAIDKMSGNLTSCLSQMTAAVAGLVAPKPPAPSAEAAAVTEMKAMVDGLKLQLSNIVTANAQMKREQRLLGYTGPAEKRAALGSASEDEVTAALSAQKDFLTLSREAKANHKCSAATAQTMVLKTVEGKNAFRLHLASKGITLKAA